MLSRTLCVLLLLLCAPPGSRAIEDHYLIGTGSKGATFYPLADALCRYIASQQLDFTCEAVETPGSAYNLSALEHAEVHLALSQLRMQSNAWEGRAPFAERHRNLRSIAVLYSEVFILAVRPGLEVSGLADLKGRRLNIGNTGSGSRVIVEALLDYLELDVANFDTYGVRSARLPELLCSGEIDAAIYSTGHPNAIYRELVEVCGVALVDLWGPDIERFVASRQDLSGAFIPAGTYAGMATGRAGFGTRVVLSAHGDLPGHHVARILEILDKQTAVLADMAPIYLSIRPVWEPSDRVAPVHPGVEDYRGGVDSE